MSLTRCDGVAVVLLVASLLGMLWKVVFTSAMFFYRDVHNYTFPSARFIHDVCRQGFLPYWNPYLNYGQPLLANPNLLFFYPFTLLIVLLPVDAAYTMHFLVHFALAGIGIYVLARCWGQTCAGAFLAAFVFMFSGPVLSLGNLYNESACAAWIPWALLVTDRALGCRRPRLWILLIAVFSLQWLAGEPMTFMATFGLCCAYAFHMKVRRPKPEVSSAGSPDSGPSFSRLLAIFFAVGAGTLLLCAAQFLPAADLLSQSRRGVQGLSFRESANWAVNPFSLLEMIVPNFFGSGNASPTGWLWLMSDSNLPYFLSIFLGFVPLFFALAGWAMGGDRNAGFQPAKAQGRQDAGAMHSNFVAGAAGIFLLLSFGHFTPVFALAYLLFPLLAVVRYPVKLLVLVTFLASILAGWGFDALRSPAAPWKTHRRRLLIPLGLFLGGVLAMLAVAWLFPTGVESPTRWALNRLGGTPFDLHAMPNLLVTILRYQLPGLAGFCLGGILLTFGLEQGKKWARPGLYVFALLAMAQLIMVNSDANPTVPKTFFTYRPPVLNEFKEPPGTYRVASFWPVVQTPDTKNLQTYINFESIPEAAEFGPMAQGTFQGRLQLATGSMLNHVEGSINLDLERSLPPYLYDLEIYQSRHVTDSLHVDCLLGRTNVKYVLRPRPAESAATRALADVFNGSPLPSRLYEDLCFAPRSFVAGNSLFSTNSAKTLDYLASPDFDALNTVILTAPPGSALASASIGNRSSPIANPAPAGQVEITHREPNSVTLQAQLARPAYVVLLERYDSNWHATFDGHPAPVLRANQIFRAVYAKSGRHEIRFDYHPRGFRVGVMISLLTLATMIALGLYKK